jgi:putative transposase
VVWWPKYRFKILRGDIGRSMRDIIRQLCEWKKIEILEGNIQVDHIHLVLSVPPKYSLSEAVGFIKGKSAIKIFVGWFLTKSFIIIVDAFNQYSQLK